MLRRLFNRWSRSLYLKIFMSFLATCVLFFVALAVFWNFYFSDLFYKDKKELLDSRYTEVSKLLNQYQENTISIREMRFGIRIVARSINGAVWIVGQDGTIVSGSSDHENSLIPSTMDTLFADALNGHSGTRIGTLYSDSKNEGSTMTFYMPTQWNGQSVIVFLHTPVVEISEAIAAVRLNILVPLLFSLLAVGLILFILSRRIAGPLQQMNRAALDFAQGDFSSRVSIRSNDEIGQLAKSFNYMVDQLVEWEDARQEFLANVSHELRSPLTTLRGFIVAMNDKLIEVDKYPHYLRICDGEVQRLQRLVTDLLDLARIQNGVDVFRTRPVALQDIVNETAELLRETVAEKELTLKLNEMSEGEPVEAEVDPDRFSQILQNLVYNAIQFTPPGGSITITIGKEQDKALVAVEDTGVGMTEEEQQRVWDRFYKGGVLRGIRTEGSGLGLTIVKHLVTGMKGAIRLESIPGTGTRFTVTFPLFARE
jgi:signal transduction histidine kinase